MRLAFFSLFLTLVVLTVNAAPDTSIQPPPLQTKESFQNTNSTAEKDAVQATEAPSYDSRFIRHGFKPSYGSNNFGIGYLTGQLDKNDKDIQEATTFLVQRTQYNLNDSAQEFGLALTTINLIEIDWGFKKFFGFNSFAHSWKPFYKLGPAAIYDPKDHLANIIDYQRYFAQVSFGFENLFSQQQQWHLEIGARSGYPGSNFFAQIFYAFPD
jgi:hypothetical protein